MIPWCPCYPHFVAFSVDDFYSMMQSPRDKPDPKAPMLPMSAIVHAHKAMKSIAPEFMFLPTVYPEFLGVVAGRHGFTLGTYLGQPFSVKNVASVSFTPPMTTTRTVATEELVIPPPTAIDNGLTATGVARVANSLVLEFSMGGVGSWETQLLFAVEGSSSEDHWHYDSGVRDPQLTALYDAAIASFSELTIQT